MSSTTTRRQRGTILALLAGPAVTLAGMAATPWEPESTSASYLETLAANPTQGQIAALLLVFGYALLGLAMFTVLRLSRGVSLKLRGPATVLAFCMGTILPGMVTVDFLQLSIAQQVPLADGARIMDETPGLFAVAQVPAVAGLVLGMILVGAAAWRAKLVGAWGPVALFASLFGGAFLGTAGIIGGSAVTLAVFGAIAARVARPSGAAAPVPVATAHPVAA